MEIVLDAVGGDLAPREIVKGAILAAKDYDTDITLVGPEDVVRTEIERQGGSSRLKVLHAPDTIEMDEHPARAVRAKKQSSIVVGVERVREVGGAFVSAGNSGATMAAGTLILGRLPGADRPALATVFPTKEGRCVLVDVGANTEVKPEWLRQFAVMGSLYAEIVLGIPAPRVGLVSNGEEETKGSQLVQAAFPMLKESGLNFVGNVEGRDIPAGKADVFVMDGFTGNVVLKLAEGVSETIFSLLRAELTSRWDYKLAAGFLRPAFRKLAKKLDYAEYGGAPLLGVKGIAIVSHGRSDSRAIRAAVRVAKQAIDHDLTGAIARGLAQSERDLGTAP